MASRLIAGVQTPEYERMQRDEALMRAQSRPVARRPDLGYKVTSGIQQRNLRRAR